jgi:6-phosphogluconate dehydrogenase
MLNGDVSGIGIHAPYYRSVNEKSNVEYDISANVFSGGIEINSAYLYRNSTLNLSSRNDFHLQLGKYFDQSVTAYKSDVLTVVSSLVNASNSAYTISAILGWFDIIK